MKNSIFALVIFVALFSSCTDSETKIIDNSASASIVGTITNGADKLLILDEIYDKGAVPIDTVKLDEKGAFEFNFSTTDERFYRLRLGPSNFFLVVADANEKIIANADASNLQNTYSVEKSAASLRLQKLNRYMSKLYISADSLKKAIREHQRTQKVNEYLTASKFQAALIDKKDQFIRQFIDEMPESIASLAAVENLNLETDFSYFKKVAASFETERPASPYAKSIAARVEEWEKLAIGAVAPEISLPNPNGETIALSSLRGNIVLIDFWASWCKPCRMENPNVVKAYNKYHEKGFEIFSVSLDKNASSWKKAIEHDGLIWKNHVSDLQQWKSVVVPLYNIEGIPLTILLDREGKIIAKNLRGQQLEQKLEELMQE